MFCKLSNFIQRPIKLLNIFPMNYLIKSGMKTPRLKCYNHINKQYIRVCQLEFESLFANFKKMGGRTRQ